MTAMDLTGVLVLGYATVCAVWTLCEARRPVPQPVERPSALPRPREVRS